MTLYKLEEIKEGYKGRFSHQTISLNILQRQNNLIIWEIDIRCDFLNGMIRNVVTTIS